MLSSEKSQSINAGEDVEKRETFYTVGWNANCYSYYGYIIFLNKLKIELPYDLAIQLVDIYPEKTVIERYMHPNVHCSTWLLIIVKVWK